MLTRPDQSIQDHSAEKSRWQKEYRSLISQRLQASAEYYKNHSAEQNKAHLRSFLTILEEAHRYDQLTGGILELIACLHPLPLRLGYGSRWEPELRFAYKHTHDPAARLDYLTDLAENALAQGNFDRAITDARKGMKTSGSDMSRKAHFCRILFNAYLAAGKNSQAKKLITSNSSVFQSARNWKEIPNVDALGWLYFNQCRLKLLREQGKVNEALELANDMIQLNNRICNPLDELSAALLTDRSTLLWVRTRFKEALNDLQRAIELYNSINDQFNAEGLQSNLGLIYWSMGEFDRSERSLNKVIDFWQRTGAIHLITYDIGNLGLVYFCQGRLDLAEQKLQQHIEHARKIGIKGEEYRGLSNLADLHYYFGEYTKTLEEHIEADKFSKKYGARDGFMISKLWVGMCQYQLGEKTAAIRKMRQVVHWCQTNDVKMLEGPALRCLAHHLPPHKRNSYLKRALQLARIQDRKLEEAGSLLQLAQVADTFKEKQDYWDAGVALLQSMGASAWLEGHSIQNPPLLPIER